MPLYLNLRRHVMRVTLSNTRLADEAVYRCEITYEEGGRWFKDKCLSNQMTKLTMMDRPEFLTVEMENGTKVEDNSLIGPFDEGSLLMLRCRVGGGKPLPEVRC